MSVDDHTIGRIEDEIARVGEVQVADDPPHLLFDGGGEVSIIEPGYRDMPEFRTHFDEILDQHAAAQHDEETGAPNDDLQAHAQLADAERRVANKAAPFVCPNPPSWDRGTLGQTVTLKAGASIASGSVFYVAFADGEPQMVAHWLGDDREVCAITVTVAPTPPLPSAILRAVAQIQWGVHGAKYEILVDVGSGFELSLSASNAYVSVFLEGGIYTSLPASSNTDYPVSGNIGFGSADREQSSVRSLRGLVTAAAAVTFVRPAFAATLLAVEQDVAGAITLDFLDGSGGVLFTRALAAGASIVQPIAMQSDVASVRVTNVAIGLVLTTLIFGLF